MALTDSRKLLYSKASIILRKAAPAQLPGTKLNK